MALDGRYARLVRIQGNAAAEEGTVDGLAARERERARLAAAERADDPLTGLGPIAGHRPRWLDPRHVRVRCDARNILHLEIANERDYAGVFALRCMPVRFPERYISLRWTIEDEREQEVGLIADLAAWPPEAQRLVREALMRRYLVHVISRVREVREAHHHLMLEVETDRGPRSFTMRWSSETAQEHGERGKVLTDVDENRYVIPDVSALPADDRRAFERYIYW
jgi:hypothetical protein